jgi:hypothetical protein
MTIRRFDRTSTAAPTPRLRPLSVLAATAVLAVALAGCSLTSDDQTVARTDNAPGAATSPAATATGEESQAGTDSGEGGTGSAEPTLPPGDPGAEVPGTDDPNGDLGGDESDPPAEPAKTTVPLSTLLDAETVNTVAGAGWTSRERAGNGDPCVTPVPPKTAGSRTIVFTRAAADGAGSSRLVQTVSTHADRAAAIAAVRSLGRKLATCAADKPTDPRIGDASVEATVTDSRGSTWTVTAVAVEGVSFVLSGSGTVTAPDVWAGLADIAQGNTCAAAADGCH